MFEKLAGPCSAPLRITRRKVGADIPFTDRAEHRIGDRVKCHIGIGMACKPLVMRDLDPAKPEFLALFQSVDVETLADAKSWCCHGWD